MSTFMKILDFKVNICQNLLKFLILKSTFVKICLKFVEICHNFAFFCQNWLKFVNIFYF